MDKLIITFLMAATVLLAACAKDQVSKVAISPDDICVAVETGTSTRTILSGEKAVEFESEDKIKVYDTSGKSAVYKYRAKVDGKVYFQKESSDEGFDIANFESAFYPSGSVKSYANKTYTASFSGKQTCTEGSFARGSAPMISFSKDSDGLVTFSNCFAVIRFAFKYATAPETPLKLDTIKLTSSKYQLSGKFEFSSTGVKYKSGGDYYVTLAGCDTLGALGTTEKYYYITLPGLASGNTADMTVDVIPTTDVPFSGTFTATTTANNTLVANNILQMKPFILKPIASGISTCYELLPWDNSVGDIKVGQITLKESDVSVNVGESLDIQIFGATDTLSLSTIKLSGGDYFNIKKKEEDSKFYVTVTGISAGSGQAFVNDEKTNSGSYLNIIVN